MIRLRLAALAAAGLLLAIAQDSARGAGILYSAPTEPVSVGSTPPADTTKAWENTTDGEFYRYFSHLGRWATRGLIVNFNANASGFASGGAADLKFGTNLAPDTTSAQPDGWWFPDSMVMTEAHFFSELNEIAGGCSLDVFVNRLQEGPSLLLATTIEASEWDSTKMALYLPDSCRVGAMVRGGAISIDQPMFKARLRKFYTE